MRSLDAKKGMLALGTGVAVAWRELRTDAMYEDDGVLHANGLRVDLTTGSVVTHHSGTLTVARSSDVHAGLYDGWAVDIESFLGVSWRGKRLDAGASSQWALVFEDGDEIRFDDDFMSLPKGLSVGQVELRAMTPKSHRRARRRILAKPDARQLPGTTMVFAQYEATTWPPPQPVHVERQPGVRRAGWGGYWG